MNRVKSEPYGTTGTSKCFKRAKWSRMFFVGQKAINFVASKVKKKSRKQNKPSVQLPLFHYKCLDINELVPRNP
jgi:hypothetical protein